MFKLVLYIGLCIYTIQHSAAQTCCSGGTPLTSNIRVQPVKAGGLDLRLSIDYNLLDQLYSGSKQLDDQTRERLTKTVFIQFLYGLSEQFSINTLFSYVYQERNIRTEIGTNTTRSNGLGDLTLMLQYSPVNNLKRQLTVAAGPKLPIGRFNAVDSEYGITLSPDLQPGSGSLDGMIGLAYQEFHFFSITGLHFNINSGYRISGSAQRFDGDFNYQFGNELIVNSGFQKAFLIQKTGIAPSLQVGYRNTQPDVADKSTVAGTGGHWVHLMPGITIDISPLWSISGSGELPIYRFLSGTQLTTTYRFNIGVSIKLF